MTDQTSLFEELNFKYSWRNYQQAFLANFSSHISDNHFHVIAPPGSGKTILGIELIRQLGKKTLVLSPTLTIRNQWEDRLQSFFMKHDKFNNISFDIKKLANLTFSTYQSLHSFYKTFEDKEQYYSYFKNNGIEVLVLDEAHHLKNEWWTCLFSLKKSSLYTIVALTATPPYDSSRTEIKKYFDLCGEIDDEIAVPNLIKEKDLCPHQDYIYFSKPNDLEINYIVEFRKKISDFIESKIKEIRFIKLIQSHRFYAKTEEVVFELYENPNLFSAILIFLKASGIKIPFSKLEILGFEKEKEVEIPLLTNEWVEILFQNFLVTDRLNLIEYENYLVALEKELKRLNVFENNKVDLTGTKRIYKSLSSSPNKLRSITSIVKNEYDCLVDDLRCVVLTDYIRKEFLNTPEHEIEKINKLGVVPIFQHLKSSVGNKKTIAVLTGSLIVIHASILADLYIIAPEKYYTTHPLACDSEYVNLLSGSNEKNDLVNIITQLFELGKIKILIGTKSLLGEGWDAPSINTLILASFVGSFVTSNQMRGRAIRSQQGNPEKVGNIWHLASIDPTRENGGSDYEMLQRRFDAFLGISDSSKNFISSGIERLKLPGDLASIDLDKLNKETISKACNRLEISKKWASAIYTGEKLNREITLFHQGEKPYLRQKELYFNDVVKYTVTELFVTLSIFIPEFLLKNINIIFSKGVLYFFYTFFTILILNFGTKTYKAIKLYLHFGMIHKIIENIALSIVKTMNELNYLTTDLSNIKIATELTQFGDITCTIKGANQIESTLFINALDEILQPIENPRYLIIKSDWLRRKFKLQNYFTVPQLFGDKKERALVFLKHWNKEVGKSKLFYTRHFEGRKLLLKARLFHAKNEHKELSKKSVIWN